MRVIERVKVLQQELEAIKDKYCSNCQDWDCDSCMKKIEDQYE